MTGVNGFLTAYPFCSSPIELYVLQSCRNRAEQKLKVASMLNWTMMIYGGCVVYVFVLQKSKEVES